MTQLMWPVPTGKETPEDFQKLYMHARYLDSLRKHYQDQSETLQTCLAEIVQWTRASENTMGSPITLMHARQMLGQALRKAEKWKEFLK